MAKVGGRYISLSTRPERRTKLEQRLRSLGLQQSYEWFPAVSGNIEEARAKGLLPGEWGLWQSWLKLLQGELGTTEYKYDWLHVIEDDVELSQPFLTFCEKLRRGTPKFDMLFTDMYVNPSVYRALAHEHEKLISRSEVKLKTDVYTGCAASVLIHRSRIEKVLHQLQQCINNQESLLPLDNHFRKIFSRKQLHFARTAPFLTGVNPESIANSTIQAREKQNATVVMTQYICTNLRHQLSILPTDNGTHELLILIQQLAKKYKNLNQHEFTTSVNLELIQIAEKNNLLSYSLQPRLQGERDNPQQC